MLLLFPCYSFKDITDFMDGRDNSSLVLSLLVFTLIFVYVTRTAKKKDEDQ